MNNDCSIWQKISEPSIRRSGNRERLRVRILPVLALCFTAVCGLLWAQPAATATETELWTFLKSSKLDGTFRTYYMNRHFNRPSNDEALAVGGWIEYETAYWHGLGAGAAVYTSQGLGIFTDPERDGASLLAPGQRSYTVLGQAYLQARVSRTVLRAYRQKLDTPFLINPYDVKMTPKTVEAYTLESRDIPHLSMLASHVTKIKGWTDSAFTSMSEAAGIEDSNEPVTLAGLVYTPLKNCKIQAWEYFAHEFMNSVYVQADGQLALTEDLTFSGSVQAIDQRDVGQALAGSFSTGMAGVQSALGWRGATLTLGFTSTASSHDIVNPWGSYPGYTSIMEEDCDLAGENAWLLGLAYDFEHMGLKGLSAFSDYTNANTPDFGDHASPDQQEFNLTIDYRFSGKLDGLWVRLRAAFVDQSKSLDGEDYSDYRVIINYDFSLL
ncbi:OprD family outer membrane porin [Verrucomicrobiota bacterium]